MKTKIKKLDPNNINKSIINEAANLILSGEIVAFPTETVYGLGANALDFKAVEKIFVAKGRPSDNPLIVHISNTNQLKPLVEEISTTAIQLIKKFWPGPLTLIFKKSAIIPKNITAGLETVAIRMPRNKIALELITKSGRPIAAPSANSFSRPSPTKASHVYDDLKEKIPLILDGGNCEVGLESTVLDLTTNPPMILRPGKITLEDIETVILCVSIDPAISDKSSKSLIPKSPGMKYKHYAPNAQIILVDGEDKKVKPKIKELLETYKKQDKKVVALSSEASKEEDYFFIGKNPIEISKNLFAVFRSLEKDGFEIIISPFFSEDGIGLALKNRLKKASSKIISL